MPLLVINQKEIEPTDYTERKTAKAIVVGDDGKVYLFPHSLIGGGLEGDETYEEALHREALEEAGITIEIIKPLGEVIGYHDTLKRKYVIQGFICKYINKITEPIDERDHDAIWERPQDSIARIQKSLDALKQDGFNSMSLETFQSKVGNREMAICFLREALKHL